MMTNISKRRVNGVNNKKKINGGGNVCFFQMDVGASLVANATTAVTPSELIFI